MPIKAKIMKAVADKLPKGSTGLKIVKPEDTQPPAPQQPQLPATPPPLTAEGLGLPPGVSMPKGPMKPRRIPQLKPKFTPSNIQKQFIDFVDKNEGIGLAAHKAGSGKCIVADSLIYTDRGLVRMGDICDHKDMEPESYKPIDINVVGRNGLEPSTEFYYDGERETLAIKTSMGSVLEGTQEHPILSLSEDGSAIYRRLHELRAGDYIAVSRGAGIFPCGWDLEGLVREDVVPDYSTHNAYPRDVAEFIRVWYPVADTKWIASRLGMAVGSIHQLASRLKVKKINRANFNTVTSMPSRSIFFRLLGMLSGDGHVSGDGSVKVSSEDDEVLGFIECAMRNMGLPAKIREDGGKCRWVGCQSKDMISLLSQVGFAAVNAPEKTVPACVLEGSREDVVNYLSGVIDTDGSLYPAGSTFHISISSSSRRLLEQIQCLLLNLGCISRIRDKWNKEYERHYYEIVISDGMSNLILSKELSLAVPSKRDRLVSVRTQDFNTNIDVIPNIGRKIHRLMQSAEMHPQYSPWWKTHPWLVDYYDGSRMPSYDKLFEILSIVPYMRGSEEYRALSEIHSSWHYWVKVDEITPSRAKVYDIVVPGTNSFVANGVVNHNTAGSIMAFLNLVKKGRAQKALVVVPAGLRVNFAEKGVKKFTDAKVGIIGNKQEGSANPKMNPKLMGDKDFYVISYDMFKKDPNYYLGITGADTVIADEIHKYKDPNTKLYKVIKNIRPNIQNFIGLSATPAMNNPFEAVSLINAISKKKYTAAQFQKQFYERAPGASWSNFFGLLGHKEIPGKITGWKNKEELAKHVGSAYHFAEPKLEDMPEKDVSVVRVPMSVEQTQKYTGILKKKLTKIERRILEEGANVPEVQTKKILNKVMAARQLSNDAGYVRGIRNLKKNPKALSMMIDATEELKSNPRAQIVMFSNFIPHGINVMENALKEAGIPYGRFTGRDKKSDREQAVRDYNSGKIKVLLVSGAGAEGLDLPNTTMIQMMDGHYNPEKITQSEARGIRRGGLSYLPKGQRKVRVKRYVAVPLDRSVSVDQSVYNIAAKKAELIKQFREIVKKWQEEQLLKKSK